MLADAETVAVLRRARARVAHGWCQVYLERKRFLRRTQVCAMGAFMAPGATVVPYTYDGDIRHFRLLERGIYGDDFVSGPEELRPYKVWSRIVDWNNEAGRTQAEVLAAFDRAIDLAVAEEEAHAV